MNVSTVGGKTIRFNSLRMLGQSIDILCALSVENNWYIRLNFNTHLSEANLDGPFLNQSMIILLYNVRCLHSQSYFL